MPSKSIPLLYLFWLALCAPVAANAAQTARWYADVALGFNIAENMQFKETGAEAEFDFTAPIGALSVGRYLGEHWRLELEAAHLLICVGAQNQQEFVERKLEKMKGKC